MLGRKEEPVTIPDELILCAVKRVTVVTPRVLIPALICPLKVEAVTTPLTNTSPRTSSFDVGFVVPMPRLPVEGIEDITLSPVVTIPSEVTPTLFAKVKNTGVEIGS